MEQNMTRERYEQWLNEPEYDVQDTVDTLIQYVRELHEKIDSNDLKVAELENTISMLEEYKWMYEDLSK